MWWCLWCVLPLVSRLPEILLSSSGALLSARPLAVFVVELTATFLRDFFFRPELLLRGVFHGPSTTGTAWYNSSNEVILSEN